MKQKTFYSIIFLFILGQNIFSQADTLNRRNSKGKKTGYWMVLLDSSFFKTTNIHDSYFYAFELFDNGETVYPYQRYRGKMIFHFDGTTSTKGKPIALNGTIKWYNKNYRLSSEDRFEKGQPIYLKSFHQPKDKLDTISRLFEEIDFTQKYNGNPSTYSYKVYSFYSDQVTKYWFRKGDKGWRAYLAKD